MAFDDLIERKYQILGEQADSEKKLRESQAALTSSQAATNPAEAAAREAAGYGQAAQGTGFGAYYSALGATQPGLATSEIGLRGAQANEANATATNINAAGFPSQNQQLLRQRAASGFGTNNFAKGTDKVPGKTPKTGNTDTTPAMLTPGEAVLNVGAAEHLGRDTIDVLNAIGNIKMMSNGAGASESAGPAAKVDAHGAGGIPGYALGSPDILSGMSGGPRVGNMPGNPTGGTWGPTPDAQPAPGSNTGIRNAVGMPGKPRPAPGGIPGYADGMSDVPGYADGTSQVMAMTHMDAARNSKAGEVGRNRKASVKADKPTGSDAGEESTRGYAKGTSKVPGKGSKGPPKGASKITPEMLQAIMSLGKGGGGLIPPGQGAPMPMAMPQVAPGQPG